MVPVRIVIFSLVFLPVLCFVERNQTKIKYDEVNLSGILKEVNGIYKDPINSAASSGNVLVTAINYAYLNHFHNFKCFADRLNMKFITFAFDRKTYFYLANIPGVFAFYFDLHASEDNVLFRVGDFNKISVGKFRCVHAVMKLGYNAIFSDPDVVMLRDPMPFFNTPGIDYMHSVNARCSLTSHWSFYKESAGGHEGNTGFYFIRSNPNTISLFEQFFDTVPRPGQPFYFLDDQTLFWNFLRLDRFRSKRFRGQYSRAGRIVISPSGKCRQASSVKPGRRQEESNTPSHNVFRSCHLDMCQFPAGAISTKKDLELTLQKLKLQKSGLYMIHGNYLEGNLNKQGRLMEEGLWLAARNEENTSWSGICQTSIVNGKLNPFLV